MSYEKKIRGLSFGKFAEEKAAEYYLKNGYAICERNWRFKKIEIDLIVRKDNVVVFVEVKARSGRDQDPVDAVTSDKRMRMARGADIYLRDMNGDLEYRFDIFALEGDEKDFSVEVYEDAFISPLVSR